MYKKFRAMSHLLEISISQAIPFQTSTTQILEKALNFLTGGNFDSSNKLPGFDASLPELINSLNGNFVFGGGELIRKAGKSTDKRLFSLGGYKSSFF